MFKVVVGSDNIRIFNIKSSEINSDLKIIKARFFSESYLSSSIFSYSILASSCWTKDLAISQLLLSCQKCCYRHIPRSIERLNPRLSMLCEARLPPFMGFNTSCLGSWWVSPITKELWIKHKQRQTFVFRCTVSLSKIQWRIGRKRQSLCLKFQIFTQWFLKKKLFHLNNNKVAIFKVYSRKRASGGRISAIWKVLPALNRAHGWAHWICSDLWNLKWILNFFLL